mmetsp:Transcript_13793/g.32196  ORF Transcript_13793/g.32196 Transcript_13793/m.32196 type:complete len:191 (-) Transcript_13793:152-724(-)
MQADHACGDDWFVASQLKRLREKRRVLEKNKSLRLAAEKIEKQALEILEDEGADEGRKKLKGDDLKVLLLFYELERKNQAKTVAKTRDQHKALKEKNASPKAYKKWSEEGKSYLESLRNEKISIDDTELGKQRAELLREQERSLALLAKQVNPQRLKDIIDAAALSLSSPADNDDNNSDSTVSVVAPWEV